MAYSLKKTYCFAKKYGETGGVKHNQGPTPKKLIVEVLRNLSGEFGGRLGITKAKIAYGKRYY